MGHGGGREHTCDSADGQWRQRQRRGSRPWSSRREETHGSRATPSNTCWGSGDCYHRSAERSTGPPNCVIQYHRPYYTHYSYAQTTLLALDNPVDVYASDSRASAARRPFYAHRYTCFTVNFIFLKLNHSNVTNILFSNYL